MAEAILSTKGLGVRYGDFSALSDVDLAIRANTIHSVIGPNGAGKTTLFHALAGRVRPNSGKIFFSGGDITTLSDDRRVRKGLARSFQVTSLFNRLSVHENLRLAAQGRTPWAALRLWQSAEANRDAVDFAEALVERLGLEAVRDRAAELLSHGQQRRLEVGMAMASRPKLILLDEPTSGMGVDDIPSMKRLIADLGRDHTVLFIEHNMGIVMDISDRITVMQSGRMLVEGPPDEIRSHPEVRRAYLGSMMTGGQK